MAAISITSSVNAYEVKSGIVCLHYSSLYKLCDPCLRASIRGEFLTMGSSTYLSTFTYTRNWSLCIRRVYENQLRTMQF